MVRTLFSKKKGKEIAESSGGEFQPGIPRGHDFTAPDPNDNYKFRDNAVVAGVKSHPVEPHEWLQFPGVTGNERNHYLNRLQDLRYKPIMKPKIVSWSEFEALNIKEPVLKMLRCKYRNAVGKSLSYPMWERVFSCDMTPVREWCLEFMSTLRVDTHLKREEFYTKKVIHFRAGGRQRHCTVPEFAYLTGMVTRDELNDIYTYEFLRVGVFDKDDTGFTDDKSTKAFWFEIGGSGKLAMAVSKVSEIQIPILKVLHRMITHCFLVRGDHNEKVSPTDVWLMRLFYEGAPYTYACAPYVLAKYLVLHKDREIVCGNFIAHIYATLGYDTARNTRSVVRVPCAHLGRDDLIGWGLIYEIEGKDVFVGDLPEEQRPVAKRRRDDGSSAPQFQGGSSSSSSFDFTSLQRQIFGLEGSTDMLLDNARSVNSMLGRVLDHQEHFRPMWERQFEEQYQQQYRDVEEDERPELPTFTPREVIPPSQSTFDYLFPQQGYQPEQYRFTPPEFDSSTHSTGYGMYTGAPRYGGDFFGSSYGSGAASPPRRSTMGTPNIIPGGDFFSEPRNPDGGDGVPSVFSSSP